MVGAIENHAAATISGSTVAISAVFGVIDGATPTAIGATGILSVVVTLVVLVFRSQQSEISALRARVRDLERLEEDHKAELKEKIRVLELKLEAR